MIKNLLRLVRSTSAPLSNSRSCYKIKAVSYQAEPLLLKRNIMGTAFSRAFKSKSGNSESSEDYVEAVVCNENDLKDNEMKVFDIGEDGKVLVIKQKGEFNAVGTKCTHYGAPLVSGALGDGRLRCQWHGACFNIKTGDIEEFPGFDSLPCHQVTLTKKGEVKVRAKLSDLKSNKRIKEIGEISEKSHNLSVVIIGGGPSGATCAESLRNEGFKGRITMIAREQYLPYDRIKVSKIGTVPEIEKLQVRTKEYYDNTNIEILLGVEATKVLPSDKKVELSDGKSIPYTHLYIATGSKPRIPNIPGVELKNIFTVRDFADAVNILNTLGSDKSKDVVVLGLSFIGLETAASCVDKSKSMTVVGTDSVPLEKVFGAEIGLSLQKLFESKGVKFQFKTSISNFIGENGVVKSVELKNGTTLPADMVIMGVGTTFYTDFLRDSGLDMQSNGAVTVNDKLQTNLENVFAGGDIAFAPVFAAGNKQMSIGHVGLAQYHGRVAALNMLNKGVPVRTVPYFWTMLFGKSIRYSGYGRPKSSMIDGDVANLKFVQFFFDENEKVIAVGSCMRDPVVSQFAEYTHQGKSLYKKDLKDNAFAWIDLVGAK